VKTLESKATTTTGAGSLQPLISTCEKDWKMSFKQRSGWTFTWSRDLVARTCELVVRRYADDGNFSAQDHEYVSAKLRLAFCSELLIQAYDHHDASLIGAANLARSRENLTEVAPILCARIYSAAASAGHS
jgi:hypothetical protein